MAKKEGRCYVCHAPFTYIWRYRCAECRHDFCSSHAKDGWGLEDDVEGEGEEIFRELVGDKVGGAEGAEGAGGGSEPPASGVLCILCFAPKKIASLQRELYDRLDSIQPAPDQLPRWGILQSLPVPGIITNASSVVVDSGSMVWGAARNISGSLVSAAGSFVPTSSSSLLPFSSQTPSEEEAGQGDRSGRSPLPPPTTALPLPPASGSQPEEHANKTVDEDSSQSSRIKGIEQELEDFTLRYEAAEALRSKAWLTVISPTEHDVWFAGHEGILAWESKGIIRTLAVQIGTYVGSYVSSWQTLCRSIPDTGEVTLKLPANTPNGWYCLRVTGANGIVDSTSAYFLVKSSAPKIVMSVGHTPSGCFCRGSSYAIQWRTRKPGDDAGEVVLLSEEEDSGDDLHEPTSLLKDAYDGKNDPILKEKDLAPPSGSAESDESDSAMDQTLLEAVAQMPAKAAGVPEGLTEVNQESSQDKEAQGQTHLDDHESVGISQAVLLHSTCNAAMALKNKSTDSKVAQEELRRWTLEQELANIDKSRSNPGSAAKSEKKTPVMGHVLEFASRFGFWKEIAFGLPDHGEYLWTVPVDVEQGRYQLRVREVGKPLECSSYPITIRDNLLFLNPNQDAIWQMKSKQIIQWDSLGVATEMELSLESMSDSFVQMIEQSLDNSGTVSWTVSNSLSVGRYRLKITDKYRTVTAYSKDIMIVPPM